MEKNWYVVVKYRYDKCDGQDNIQEYRYESKEAAVAGVTKHFFKTYGNLKKQGAKLIGAGGLKKESGLLVFTDCDVRIDIVEK